MTDLEVYMLSAPPFTYGDVCKARETDDTDRLIDRTIQRLRRKGFIAYRREGRRTVWSATDVGRAALFAGPATETRT